MASSVTVDITGIDPDPAWMDTPVTVQATAAFSAEGREQDQAAIGWIPEFRWKWEFLTDGTVTGSDPALNPQTPGWSEWSPLNFATGTGTFPTALVKQVKVTVQVRMTPTSGNPSASVCEANATEALTVWELKDVTNLHVVRFEPGVVVLAWDQADCPGVAGYKYHIEPDQNTLTDVGNSTQVTIPNLAAGQTYTVGVHTYDILGHMTHTAILSFTTPTSLPPPVPLLLVFPDSGGTGVDVLWVPPAASNIGGYEVKAVTSCTTVSHVPGTVLYQTNLPGLTEGQVVDVMVRVYSLSSPLGFSQTVTRSVMPVPFQDTHDLQRKIDEKHLALTGSSSGVGWTTSLSSPSALTEMRYALILLNERSRDNTPGAALSYYTGYDSYGADRGAPYLPAHFMDTSWPCIPIPGATGWLPTPALSYFNVDAKTNLSSILGLITLWRSAASDGCTVVSNDAATDLGMCSLWSSISWDHALSRSAFAFQTRYYPGASTYFGFQGSAHFENDFFDWWLVDTVQDTCVRVERHFPPNARVDQYFWTDTGACSPDGTLVKDYPFGGVPTSSTWGDPDGSPTHGSTGYSYYGRITDNIYAQCKTVDLTPPATPEFQYQPSATITYAGVGQKIPVWVKVKYDNPLDSTKPVWIPAKVECADANSFICNQGWDSTDPTNGDCGAASSVFVALASGTYNLTTTIPTTPPTPPIPYGGPIVVPTITFDKDPVVVGIGGNRTSETPPFPLPPGDPTLWPRPYRLTATITPKEAAGFVSFESSDTSRATVVPGTSSDFGVSKKVIIVVTGVTGSVVPNDTRVLAKVNGYVTGSTAITVLKPTNQTQVAASVVVKENVVWGPDKADGVPVGRLVRYSAYHVPITITVKDQFHQTLSSIYDGAPVTEHFDGVPGWRTITTGGPLIGGVIIDFSGRYVQHGDYILPGSAEAISWPISPRDPFRVDPNPDIVLCTQWIWVDHLCPIVPAYGRLEYWDWTTQNGSVTVWPIP